MLDLAAAAVPMGCSIGGPSKNLGSMGRGAMGSGGMGSGAWKGAMGTPNGHGLGIHGAGCGPNPGAAWCAGIWGAAGALGAGLGIGGALGGVFGAGGPGLGKSSSEELGSLCGRGVGNLPFKGSLGLGRLGGVAGDGDLVGGGWNGSYSVEAAGLWTSSKLAMSFMGAPPWAICAGCAWSRLVGASVALNAVVAESVVSELEEWTSVMAELEN